MLRLTAALILTLVLADPASAETVVVGHSSQGRAIVAKRYGDADAARTALFIGQIHGDEPAGIRVAEAIKKLDIKGVDVWVIDTVNPDGNAHHTRQNAHGVDLNRNFPSQLNDFTGRRSPRCSRRTKAAPRCTVRPTPRSGWWKLTT